ncbi:MAG: beta-propeller domain-containing protein [Nocardioides sp.]
MDLLRRTGLAVACTAALGVSFAAGITWAGQSPSPPAVHHAPPRLVGAALDNGRDCDQLLAWYVDRALPRVTAYGWTSPAVYASSAAGVPLASDSGAAPAAGSRDLTPSTSSATGTNVQEAGVDEPDVVKSDGRLLVRVQDGRLVSYDVSGAHVVRLGSATLTGLRDPQLLLAGHTVVAVGVQGQALTDSGTTPAGARVITFDLADPAHPRAVDTRTFAGTLVVAREHGDVVRLVVSTGLPDLDFTRPGIFTSDTEALRHNQDVVRSSTIDDWLPQLTTYSTTGVPTRKALLPCSDVAVPATDGGSGTLAVIGFDAAHPATESVTAVATDSTIAYLSPDRLYLAQPPYAGAWGCCGDASGSTQSGSTALHAFALDGTTARYLASGTVDGLVADRWSIDEYDGVLRVAVGPTTATGPFNSVVTLRRQGSDLVEVGRLDRLGPGETIRAMRWFDGLAVMVTFRQVDPLLAIDLTSPRHPRLLGALHVPGYSTYLHPLGKHRMLGIGQDVDPVVVTPVPGPPTATPLPQQGATSGPIPRDPPLALPPAGAKATLFGLADLTHPKALSTVHYPRGTTARIGFDTHQFTWLPDQHVALTVLSGGYLGQTGWVSVLRLHHGQMTNHLVRVEYGAEVAQVRTVPLPDGRVVLVTGDAVSFFRV